MQESADTPRDAEAVIALRQSLMRLCAAATLAELQDALGAIGDIPGHEIIRQPEIGLVMLRGRMGGDGAAFNLGEATVTRAAIRLETGETGFACLLGRVPPKARAAALIDALAQRNDQRGNIDQFILEPIQGRVARDAAEKASQTAATRVNFFTLVRGEDA